MKSILHSGYLRLPMCILMLGLLSMQALSQETPTCAEKLQSAKSLFERGQVEQIPELLNDCLEKGFNREESLEAYKLLIQVQLFNEKLGQADSAMLSFLKKYPEYKVSSTDHSSFVGLFNNFVSKVIIQFSLHMGSNLPFMFIKNSTSLFGVPGEKKYSSKPANLFISLETKYKLTSRIELNAELGYSQFAFSNSEKAYAFGASDFEEIHRRIEIPVTITYDVFRVGKFTSYGRFGAGPVLRIDSYGTGEFSLFDRNNPYRRTGENIKSLNRIFMDISLQAGAGLKYKIREGFFCAEVRSNFGIFNQSDFKSYSGDNLDKAFFYMSGEDDFSANMLNLTLGYTYIFYKPVRREE